MWIKYNPNPLNKQVGDCTIRAITRAENLSWDYVYDQLARKGKAMADMPSSDMVWGSLLYDYGYTRHTAPNFCKYGQCYTVADFARDHPYGTYLVCQKEHVVAVSEGDWYDTWDCGNKTVIFYWAKER